MIGLALASGLLGPVDAALASGPVVGWGAGSPPSVVASAVAAGWDHTLAIALPEPEHVASLVAGCLLLVALERRRAKRARALRPVPRGA